MHEHEKRVLEGLLFLSGDEGLSIEQLNGCVEESWIKRKLKWYWMS